MKIDLIEDLTNKGYKETSDKGPTNSRMAIAGLSISLFLMNLDTSIVSVGLPKMIASLKTTFAFGQWFVLVYLLVLTSLITAVGRLGDIIGKKKLYLSGIVIFTISSLLCGLASNGILFILFRCVQGLGAAFILSLGFAIATEITPKQHLGKIMGILSTITALGIACGPVIGGILLSAFGWQSMFLVNILPGIVAYWLTNKYVHVSITKKLVSIDWIGIILLATTLLFYCIGVTIIEQRGVGDWIVLLLIGLAIVGLFSFILFEQNTPQPLLNLSIFSNPIISRNLVATMLVYTVIITTVTLPPFYLLKAAGYSPIQVGLIMSVGPLITVALSVYAGKVADKYNAKNVMFYAILVISLGCFCMSTVKLADGPVGFLWRMAIIALGLNFFKTPNNTVIMGTAQPDQRGILSSFLSLSRILGQITGTAIMGAIFAVLSGAANISHGNGMPSDIAYGFDKIFLINAFIALSAALIIYPKLLKKTTV